ncbi:MAG TPA: GH92 family glycosyl hydrolase [Pelobium sp.]
MKNVLGLVFVSFFLGFNNAFAQSSLIDFVQPFCGTSPSTTLSALQHAEGTENLANTIPAVTLPFAMTQFTPQTRAGEQKCNAPFYFDDPFFSGIRASHWLSGSCVPDYGSFTVMPTTGLLKAALSDYQTKRDTLTEIATPAYYKVLLKKYKVTAEVTPTLRSCIMQFTTSVDTLLNILITPNSDKSEGYIKIDQKNKIIYGYNPVYRIYQGWGKPAGFNGYFVVEYAQPELSSGTFSGDKSGLSPEVKSGKDIGAFLTFDVKKGQPIKLRIGTSFTSLDDAKRNLSAEIADWNFDKIKLQAENTWEATLGKIAVETTNVKAKRIFYTAMYHAMLHPRLASNVNSTYTTFDHYYKISTKANGAYYDDFPMWDIYRAQLPLLQIIQPQLINNFVQSMVLKGQQGNWLPIFPCWGNYTSAMIGDHVTAFIASSFNRGFRDYNVREAYRIMKKNAYETPDSNAYNDGKGRRALTSYLKYKYIPLNDSVWQAFHKREQVSRTLEYAFDDYSLSTVAKALGEKKDYRDLKRRGKNYKNVFDKSLGFVNGRYADGTWATDFNPDSKMPFITEGTPRQYTFYVPQDVAGLARLMGGKHTLEKALDSIFAKKQYWHGNEPSHQIPFMYNYTKAPWKTQVAVKKILAEEYDDGRGGLSGNDDAGQMSAWYIFSSMGFYPLNPVSGTYELTTPLFDKVIIKTAADKNFTISVTPGKSKARVVKKILLNGKKINAYQISYQSIMAGGKLDFILQ